MHRIRGKLTYSNVMVTVLAVLVVGGGTAYAAAEMLPKNSVGAKQIEKGAVTPAKLSKASKATLTGPAGANGATGEPGSSGPQGPVGDPGPKGEPGTAKAWAEIDHTGVVVRSSPGVTVTAFLVSTGTYCVKAEPFNNSNSIAIVTLNDSDAETKIGDGVVIASTETSNACPDGGHYFAVYPSSTSGTQKDAGFLILID